MVVALVSEIIHNRSFTEAIHLEKIIDHYHYTSPTINNHVIINKIDSHDAIVEDTNTRLDDIRLVPPIPADKIVSPDMRVHGYMSSIDNHHNASDIDNMDIYATKSVKLPESNQGKHFSADSSFGKKNIQSKRRGQLDVKHIQNINAGKVSDNEKGKDKAFAATENENNEAFKQIEREYSTEDLINEGKQIQRAKIWFYLRHFNIDAKKPTYDQIETSEDFYGMNHPIIVCQSICEKLDKQSKMALKGRSADAVTFIFRDSIWRNVLSQSAHNYFEEIFKDFQGKYVDNRHMRKMVKNFRDRVSPTFKSGFQFSSTNSKSNAISKADQQTVMAGDLNRVSRVDWSNLPRFNNIQPLISAKATLVAKIRSQANMHGALTNFNKSRDMMKCNNNDDTSITLEQLDRQSRRSLGIALVKINNAIIAYYKDLMAKEIDKDSEKRDDAKINHCLRMISKIEKRSAGPNRNMPQGTQLGSQESNPNKDFDKTPESVINQRNLERELDNEAKKFEHNKKYLIKDGERPLYELPVLKEFTVENYSSNVKLLDQNKFLVRIRLLPTSPQEFFAIETWTTDEMFIRIKLIASSVFQKDIMSDMTVSEKVNGVISFLVRALVFDSRNIVSGFSSIPDFDVEQGIKRRNDALQNPLTCPVF